MSTATEQTGYHRTAATDVALHNLGRRRRTVGFLFAATLLTLWLGFVLVVAFAKSALSSELVPGFTVALAGGLSVMLGAWLLACLYMLWAERSFDAALAQAVAEPGA